MRSKLRTIAMVTTIVSTGIILHGCSGSPPDHAAHAMLTSNTVKIAGANNDLICVPPGCEEVSGIKLGKAESRLLDLYVDATGEVLANANLVTHVEAPVAGRVTSVSANVGEKVNTGQTLCTIHSTDIEQVEADMLQTEAQILADRKRDLLQADLDIQQQQAQLHLTNATFQRQVTLVDEKIASRASYELAKTELEKDQINLSSLKKKRSAIEMLSREKLDLARETICQRLHLMGLPEATIRSLVQKRNLDPVVPILSPETGVVTERSINIGELTPIDQSLFQVADLHSVWLAADIYEKDVAKIAIAQPIVLQVDSFPGQTFSGRLNFLSDSINPDTRTLAVRAEVPNPGLKLKPKMFGRMRILVGKHMVLTVPSSAVQDAGDSKVVYEPVKAGVYKQRKVTTGMENAEYVEIINGLHDGEPVVTSGSFDLRSQAVKASN